MATKNSGTLSPGASYTLGKYTFTIGRDYSEDEGTTTIIAACSDGTKRGYKYLPLEGDVAIESWHVNANDTTADVYVTTDRLPVRIEVTTPPTKTEYVDGELLDPTGIVLTAYYEDGTEWGHPASNITYSPHYADVDQAASGSGASSDLNTNWAQPIPLYDAVTVERDGSVFDLFYPVNGAVMLIYESTRSSIHVYFASANSGIIGRQTLSAIDITANNQYTINGKTVYYAKSGHGWIAGSWDSVEPQIATRSEPDKNTLWTAVYGTITTEGAQPITVTWKRPTDGEELTTSFDITVTAVNDHTHSSGTF